MLSIDYDYEKPIIYMDLYFYRDGFLGLYIPSFLIGLGVLIFLICFRFVSGSSWQYFINVQRSYQGANQGVAFLQRPISRVKSSLIAGQVR